MECNASKESKNFVEHLDNLNTDLQGAINNLISVIIEVNRNQCPKRANTTNTQKYIPDSQNNNSVW